MTTSLIAPAAAQRRVAAEADLFGNPLDPIVRYARGSILAGTAEEVRRMLRARHIVGERVRSLGTRSIYDLSGMNRGSGLTAEDVAHLATHVPFFAYFEGKTEPLALKHMGADASTHSALILNRVSAANFIALTTLLEEGDVVYAFAPAGGATHPSAARPVAMAHAQFRQFHRFEDLKTAWEAQVPRLLLVTPISASKRHIPLDEFKRALALPRAPQTLVYVDDAHMASRVSFFDEPPTFQVGAIDIAVCSADKHVAGPRAGIMVGRSDLITRIGSRAYELGLEAQAGQYAGVGNALRNFDRRVVKDAGELAKELVQVLAAKYGAERAYLGGPGVSLAGDHVLQIAMEQTGKRDKPQLVAVEAAGLVAMQMLEHAGVLTIGSVSMPGSAPAVRLMMYPDGRRLGIDGIVDALENGIARLGEVLYDTGAARAQLLGA